MFPSVPIYRAFILTFLIASFVSVLAASDEDNWNDENISWTDDWDSAVKKAGEEKKPLMVLIHRTWCGACKSLRPKFAGSKEIASLSEKMVMVRSAEDSKLSDGRFSPDGGYFPRILFYGPDGKIYEDIVSRTDKYKYFHSDPSTIVDAMKKALDRGEADTPEKEL